MDIRNEMVVINYLKTELYEKGFDDRQILENFQLKIKERNLYFDLVVLSSDNRKIMIFEIKNFTEVDRAKYPHLTQLFNNILESGLFDQVSLFIVNQDFNINLFMSNAAEHEKRKVVIPNQKSWDNAYMPETKVFHFKGTRDVSLLALTSYLVTTTQNYFKFLNLNKLLELYILGDIEDSRVYLSKSTKYNYYYESINNDFEYARSSVIMGNKSDAELFWKNFIKLSNPMLLIEKHGKLTPIFDFKSSDLKIKRIEVNSPPLIDVEGIVNAGINLYYAQEKRNEERTIHNLQVEQMELQNEMLRIMNDKIKHGEISQEEVIAQAHNLFSTPLVGYIREAQREISLQQQKNNNKYGIYQESIDIRV